MSMDNVAANMTGVGYVAAVIGLILSVVVLMLRFRARNLEQERRNAELKAQREKEVQPVPKHAPQPKPLFKEFKPQDSDK